MGSVDSDTGLFGLALSEAIRAAADQASDIARIRDRTFQVVGLGGATVAVLGGVTADDGRAWGAWAWFAILLYGAAVATATWILWPKKLPVPPYPSKLVAWAEAGASPDDMARDLALYLEDSYEDARTVHRWMVRAYCCIIGLTGAMVIALVLSLRSP
jgi:hypothetical protein